ncbi:hypothetical protein SipoB123_16160 [Streptomyces ipomoeae]|nr:hypothetical protein SipoB123_16160 [Streptomyces ipomoeae]
MGDMVGEAAESKKGMGAGAQAISAVVLVGALCGGMLAMQHVFDDTPGGRDPAVCSTSDDATPASRHVTGAQLCTALNRPDLPTLLGTPREQAQTASGSESSVKLADGAEYDTPEATVALESHTVKLSASFDDLPVAESVDYLGESAQPKTVLGHPAVLYSGQTIALTFNNGKTESGPGSIARRLLVAGTPKDDGTSFELVIWREDDVLPDDAALFRMAEEVLPTIPGWNAG